MFVSTNTCDGKGECIKQCPTKAIRLINGKALSCLTCGLCYKIVQVMQYSLIAMGVML